MAKIKLNSYIKSIHGRVGNIIYYNVKGCQYARSYSIPRNPGTAAQQKNRTTFARAVKQWQNLQSEEKAFYNHLAQNKPLSGYNIFISMQMNGITANMLKTSHGKQVKYNLIPAYYQRNNTSVIPFLLYASAMIYRHSGRPVHKKPPGIQTLYDKIPA